MVNTTYAPLSQLEDPPRIRHIASDSFTLPNVRPPIYYGQGAFSPPSSVSGDNVEDDDDDDEGDEEEDQKLLEKRRSLLRRVGDPGVDLENVDPDYLPPYEGSTAGLVVGGKRSSPLRYLLLSLLGLVVLAGIIGILAAHSYNGATFRVEGVKPLTMDHVFNGTFSVTRNSVDWVAEAGDGIYSSWVGENIILKDLNTNTTRILVKRSNVKDEHGAPLSWNQWKLSPDMKYVLLKTDHLKQWRHSSFGNYYIYSLESGTTHALIPPTSPPTVAYATWSPTGESIAYVSGNDLYVLPSPQPDVLPIRVTTQGNSSIFHGVPDWVYEEEVFSNDYALWWSPDATKVAFLRLDETKVEEFIFPIYNPTEDSYSVHPYTKQITMKYPKPGYANPLASLHVFDLARYSKAVEGSEIQGKGKEAGHLAEAVINATTLLTWDGMRKPEDSIIMEVTWVGNDTLIAKEVNRSADDGSVVLFVMPSAVAFGGRGRVVRRLGKAGEEGDDGWIESEQNIYPLPQLEGQAPSYLDIVPTKEGFNHIALFSPADSGTPLWLTSGEWEVTGGIKAVDHTHNLVYFVAANKSIDRHLYSVALPTASVVPPLPPLQPTPITDASQSAWYSASFSPKAGYYVLGYEGPNIPWQRVISVRNASFEYVLSDNKELNITSSMYQAPVISRYTIESDGYELNTMEIQPPNMDDSGRVRYPVLFRVYGGPGSQMVHTRFEREWHHYLACSLKYIVVIVDGRGTGFKGRKLRNTVRNNLGFFETKDQINAARLWATKRYVDPHRIGIWGWSYGGFMTSKVMEANAGIHTLGMAVAPVTSWRLYDSIYTERYMGLPDVNPGGYVNASISNVTGFHDVNYLLAHGSGDDNVHYANSAHLLDMFTRDHVRDYRFRMFTDSDHSINKRGAYRELFEWMTAYLVEKWGKGGTRRSG